MVMTTAPEIASPRLNTSTSPAVSTTSPTRSSQCSATRPLSALAMSTAASAISAIAGRRWPSRSATGWLAGIATHEST